MAVKQLEKFKTPFTKQLKSLNWHSLSNWKAENGMH